MVCPCRAVSGQQVVEGEGVYKCGAVGNLPMKMEPIVSSETSAIRTQTPGNYPKRNKLHLEHGESLQTRTLQICLSTKEPNRSVWLMYLDLDVGKNNIR